MERYQESVSLKTGRSQYGSRVMSLEQLKEGFLLEQACRNNSKRTIQYYSENINRLIVHLQEQGISDADGLTKESIQRYIMHLRGAKKWSGMAQETSDGISSKSLQTYVRAIKVWLTWTYQEGYINDPSVINIKLPRAKRTAIEIIDDTELRKIIEYLQDKAQNKLRDLVLVLMLYECGLRLSEIVGLKLSNVKLSDNKLKVLGKGDKERVVVFGANLSRLIYKYVNMERPVCKTDALFIMKGDKPVTTTAVKRLFRNLQIKLDMPRLHPHLFRHTFCTTYLRKGGDIFALKVLTGHESFQILNMYLHLAKGMDAISNSISLIDSLDEVEQNMHKKTTPKIKR